jgi:hypothetical protein
MSEIVTDPVPPTIRMSSWLALFLVTPLCASWIVAKKLPVTLIVRTSVPLSENRKLRLLALLDGTADATCFRGRL